MHPYTPVHTYSPVHPHIAACTHASFTLTHPCSLTPVKSCTPVRPDTFMHLCIVLRPQHTCVSSHTCEPCPSMRHLSHALGPPSPPHSHLLLSSCARCLEHSSAVECTVCQNLLFSTTPWNDKTCMTERDSEGCRMTFTLYQPDRSDINSIYIKKRLGEAGQCPDLVQVGHSNENSGHRCLCRYQEG